MDDDAVIRLLGPIRGKRVLELGCGAGDTAVQFAQQGATVIGVDSSAEHIASARAASEAAEVRLELHTGDLADLAFLRADSVDVAFSDGSLAQISDLGRLFRQVHRVLRHGAPFVFTLPHPVVLGTEVEPSPEGSLPLGRTYVSRSYFDSSPIDVGTEGQSLLLTRHTLTEVFTGLTRTGFRVDTLLEPEPARSQGGRALLPDAVVWRARKEGS
ncbi:MAG: class I SAM-dependent methyltransferase [Acidimicrobiia bacterium]